MSGKASSLEGKMKIKLFAYISLITALFTTSFVIPGASFKSSSYWEKIAISFPKFLTSEPNIPLCPSGISYGETIECSISSNETDTYTFDGDAGDRVVARLQITSGNIDPVLSIDNPLCTSSTIFNLLELGCTLTSSGTHTINVSGSASQTGGYNLHLQRSNNPANQTAIAYGQTLSGNITVAPEMDVFAFTGSTGDHVIVRMQITSGSLDPFLRIYNPDGSQLCTGNTIFNALEINCTLATDGLHMIFAHGGDGQTGGYNLHLQRSNNPANQTAIAYGQTLSGNITVAPEMDVFAFTGSTGDHVIVRMQITSGSLDPFLRIYNPDGSQLCTGNTIFNALEINCTLATDGLHMIFAHGGDGQTGGYNLHLQRSNNPANQTAIAYGQTLSGNITVAPEMDVFAFTGSTGDHVIVRMQITSGSLDPFLRIYNPDGSQLCTGNTIFNALEINCTLATDGLHMIFAHGGDGQTGGYNLHLQRSNNPANQTAIAYGQTLSGNITVAPEMDVFAFTGSTGDHVIVRMQITSGSLDPFLRIYNPDGSQLCTGNTIFNALEINCTLATDGLHMIFAHGGDGQTGGYNLHLQRSNNPANQTAIAYGQTLSGNITVAPEMDVFAFTGSTGDHVIVRMQITSGSLDPFLRIYNPDGSQLCTGNTIFNALEINCTLATDGLHMIFAHGGDGQTGGYNLHLQRSNNPANQTAIAYGQTLSGNITVAPEMDVFAFTGSTGDHVIVRMQITSGSLDPFLRIYNPDGSQLCTGNTIFNALEINCTLATDGLHMIFAHGGDGQTGGYNLHLQRSNNPANQTAIAYGQTLSGNITVAPEMDVYNLDIEVFSGDILFAHLKTISSNIDPHLRIYQQDGTLLCENNTIFSELELSCNVNTTGTYTVFVFGGDNQTGSYEVCVHNNSTTCGYQVFLPLVNR